MELGDHLAAEPAAEGPRQSDHLDRAPSHRSRRDDHRQRGRYNQSLVSPKMTKFVQSSLPVRSIKLEIASQIEDRVRAYKRIVMYPEKDKQDPSSCSLQIKYGFRLLMSGRRRGDLPS